MQTKTHNRSALKPFRKTLRANMTPAEAALWKHLQRSQLEGRKFRRQHGVASFIVDFYCPDERLAIELDGSPHDTESGWQRDEQRTNALHVLGIKVIRFENRDVLHHTEGVLTEIKRCFRSKA